LYQPRPAGFLIEHADPLHASLGAITLGTVTDQPVVDLGSEKHALAELLAAWTGKLEHVYPTQAEDGHSGDAPLIKPSGLPLIRNPQSAIRNPRVLIPAFPGTNSEYDSAKAFAEAGAATHIEVFRNLSAAHIEQSLERLAGEIRQSQILFIPGGFSAGDEPDGSAKFIATVLRNPRVADAVMDLIKNRDGLVLGICNGFQALIKTGLVPYGEIREATAESPTLFNNDIGRHLSCYAWTRVVDNRSPWFALNRPGDLHRVPLSHGEGKFVASDDVLSSLIASGQVATQYCDANGLPSMDITINPNGSIASIEGITSPCGRVLGKMGHSERRGTHVAKNVPGDKFQPIFAAGVRWFA
jgi:phosphoribosylformylglycinamidine synthase